MLLSMLAILQKQSDTIFFLFKLVPTSLTIFQLNCKLRRSWCFFLCLYFASEINIEPCQGAFTIIFRFVVNNSKFIRTNALP